MLLRPDRTDYSLLALYLCRVLTLVGVAMLVPAVMGTALREFQPALTFVIGAGLAITVGQLGEWRLHPRGHPSTGHGLHAPALLADEVRQAVLAEVVGRQFGPLAAQYEDGLPDDPGPAEVLLQPGDITRFAAAHMTWRGGTNAVDAPDARVERLVEGIWEPFADGSGEVPVTTELPEGIPGMLTALTGGYEQGWTAAFEAFSAFPARLGQPPAGTYRFTVEGHRRSGGATVPYQVTSDPFTVSPWGGVVVDDLVVDGGRVVAMVDDSTYPRTYESPFAMIADDGGEAVPPACRSTCAGPAPSGRGPRPARSSR